MKTKEGFELVKLGDSSYILETNETINKVITFNSTAAYLWNAIKGLDFNEMDIASLLEQRYGLSHDDAINDGLYIIDRWKKASIIIETN